jgi:hypothetical protein
MRARPLLYDIARLGISHWQLSADLAHQMHLTACPKFVISGVSGELDLEMGPDRNLVFSDPGARAQWVGAPTDGLQSVMSRIEQLETQMQSLAVVSMSMQRSGVESAMSKLLERAQGDSQLAVIVSSLEDSLNKAMEMAAAYRGVDAPKLVVNKDFSPLTIEAAQVTVYSSLVTAGLLSHRTFLSVMQQGEVFEGVMVDGKPWTVDAELDQLGEYEAVTPLDQLEVQQGNRQEDMDQQQANREQDLAQQQEQQAQQAEQAQRDLGGIAGPPRQERLDEHPGDGDREHDEHRRQQPVFDAGRCHFVAPAAHVGTGSLWWIDDRVLCTAGLITSRASLG